MKNLKHLTDEEKGFVFDEIIKELAAQDEISVNVIISLLSKEYGITEKEIKEYLTATGSIFVKHSDNPTAVVGFIDNFPLKRTTERARIKNILKKIYNNYTKQFDAFNIKIINTELKNKYMTKYYLK